MKKISYISVLMFTLLGVSSLSAFCASQNNPANGLVTSDVYTVKLNEKSLWAEKYTSSLDYDKLPDWFNDPYVLELQEMHITDFEFSEPGKIKITAGQKIQDATIRPLSRKITPQVKGNEISFNIGKPGYLVVEIDNLPPLFLFANPKEEEQVEKEDKNTLYFGPGVHEPGYIPLKDNQTVYLAKGAVVYGGLRGEGITNVTVKGRGILDAGYNYNRMVTFDDCKNIRVEGITIRNSRVWTNTITNCDNVVYTGVKVISFGPGGDGINPLNSRDVTISECFLRCTDDCIAIKSPHKGPKAHNITVKNNVMIGFANSDGVTIGFETNEDISDVSVKNCDVLLARGGSRVDGHSGFSIICDGPGVISNVVYEDIRVEQAEVKLFELHITDGTRYGEDPPGHIRNVTLRNINWLPGKPIVIQGYNENHVVQDVVFEDCEIDDKPLLKVYEKYMKYQQFTEDITIVQSGKSKKIK